MMKMPTRPCPVLTDLNEAAADLRAALKRIRRDLDLCARCPANPCHSRIRFDELVGQAAAEALEELRHAGQ